MNPDYVVSEDVAQKMKEAGYPQEGCDCYWHDTLKTKDDNAINLLSKFEAGEYILSESRYVLDSGYCCNKSKGSRHTYAAPCYGRLGEELPDKIIINGMIYVLLCMKTIQNEYIIQYTCRQINNDSHELCYTNGKKEANARGLMWLELTRMGLI